MATLLQNSSRGPVVLHYQYWYWLWLIHSTWALLLQWLVYHCIDWWLWKCFQNWRMFECSQKCGSVCTSHYCKWSCTSYWLLTMTPHTGSNIIPMKPTFPLVRNAVWFAPVVIVNVFHTFIFCNVSSTMTQLTIPTCGSSSHSSLMVSPLCLSPWQCLSSSVPRHLVLPRDCSLVCGMPLSASDS